jgi:hypothetical protein
MAMKQMTSASIPVWSPCETATRDLNEDFLRTVLEIKHLAVVGGLIEDKLIISALTPINLSVFNWDAAEKRADWEETHSRFVEFGDIKDLLSDLHS